MSGVSAPRIAFIGLGNMGQPMARNLRRAGFSLAVNDVRWEAGTELIAEGARWTSSPREVVAEAEVLITMLPGPREVQQVLIGSDGAASGLRAGATWIDMSTSSPEVARAIGDQLASAGVSRLDAPVSGMAKGAHAGTLQIFVGGDYGCFQEHLPVLRAMGDPERIFHVGPHGAGYTVKLLINLLWFIHSAAAAEVLVMGVRSGVDLEVLRRSLVASPANSHFVEHDVLSVFTGDYDQSFPLALACKDLGLAVDMGRDLGVPVEVSALVEQIHRRARAQYGERGGEMLAVKLVEDAAGTELRLPTGDA